MSYLQEEGWSRRTWVSVIAVAVLHIFLGYALISGLAIKAVKVITGPLETVNIEEQAPPPEEAPPPPPKLEDIPPYVPPPDVQIETSAPPPPTISTQTVVPQPAPTVAPPAPPPAPPPPPAGATQRATPRGKLGAAITNEDYPDASQRAGEEGTTQARYEIGVDGRVTAGSCQIARSSGFDRLDRRACELIERRFRFNPALADGKPVPETRTQNIRWQIPED
jgi:protein TonB